MMSAADRARAYLAKLPPAVSGAGGHAATFAAACRLVEFGLTPADAWPLLAAWNGTHCDPPWSESDLRHKLADAFRKTRPREDLAGPQARREWRPLSSPSPRVKRPALPPLRVGTPAELKHLATLRRLSLAGVSLASDRGLLRFGDYRGRTAWLVLDKSRRIAQARRLDGKPWADGVKAWTLPGSQTAWPVGIEEAASCAVVALVEGGPDLLAACTFIVAEERGTDAAAVAMLGASCAIAADALPQFRGKRVRIFTHADEAGHKAGERWFDQLSAAGADVDCFAFDSLSQADGQPIKDLNDLTRVSPDDFEAHRCLWVLLP